MINSLFASKKKYKLSVFLATLVFIIPFACNEEGGNQQENIVNIRYDAAASNLNPYLTSQGADIYACARIYNTMGEFDPNSLELLPTIITQMPEVRTVEDGEHQGDLAYDFEILPEAKWDNGTPVTGLDMAFTLKLIFHPLLPTKAYLGFFKDLSGIDIDAENPKKFTMYFSNYYILALESVCQIPLMPAYNYDPESVLGNVPFADFLDTDKMKAMEQDPQMKKFSEEFQSPKYANDPQFIVGSGPYRMETMNDQGLILVKKQNWWGDKLAEKHPILAAYPQKLVYKVVQDENVMENMIKAGELDIIAGAITPTKYLEMKDNKELADKYEFTQLPALKYSRWLLNLSKPKLQDVRVRKALAHIVDYDHFINNINKNLAVRSVSPILPNKEYYAKNLEYYDFNIEKAKELLLEAGWKDSDGDGYVDKIINGERVKLEVEILISIHKSNELYGESLKQTGSLAGIQIKPVKMSLPDIGAKTRSGDFDSALLGAVLYPGLSELSQRYHSKYVAPAGDNRSRYINPKLDLLLESISSEKDDAKRNPLYLEAQRIIYNDLPEIFLLSPVQFVITSKKFEGVVSQNRPGYYEQLFKLKK